VLDQAGHDGLAYVILDGKIFSADRCTNQKLDYWPTRTIFECFSLTSCRDDCWHGKREAAPDSQA
jgi:hypothetical protein